MAKKVAGWSEGFQKGSFEDIHSVSGCISENFTEYIPFWKHNGFWLFNSPEVIRSLAIEHSIDITPCRFFYYEVFEQEFDQEKKQWQTFEPEKDFETAVQLPDKRQLEGYDVVTFLAHTSPECSPLSCNYFAGTIPVNQHCLLRSFEEAKQHIETGAFDNSEPGPVRIFAVYSVAIE